MKRKEFPSLAVIVPVKNEAEYLPAVLDALVQQREAGYVSKIIVVDNGSTDGSREYAQSQVKDVLCSLGTVAKVRNTGANAADCEYLAFVDADVVVSKSWGHSVRRCICRTSEANRNSVVMGSVCGIPSDANWLVRTWHDSLARRQKADYINSGNMIVSKSLFNAIGGFDESLVTGEDVDLCQRAQEKGGLVVETPDVHAIHLGYPATLADFYRREKWHGRSLTKYLRNPLQSKALVLALANLMVMLLAASALAFGRPEQIFWIAAGYCLGNYGMAALRLRSFSFPRVFRLSVLLAVYGFARAHALVQSLLAGGVKGRQHL